MGEQTNPKFLGMTTPAAILAGSVIIAAAIVFAQLYDRGGREAADKAAGPPPIDEKKIVMAPVRPDEHVYGNPRAPVFLVEYADIECPFCRTMHPTLKRIVDDSGGKIGWVYRHFPLDSLHPRARKAAIATECAAELGGNDKFWEYLNWLLRQPPASDRDIGDELARIAVKTGLSRGRFKSCLGTEIHDAKVEANYQEGVRIGIVGTPTIIAVGAGAKKAIVGAQSEENVKAAIAKLAR
jgi:protein-disulfide isomerase